MTYTPATPSLPAPGGPIRSPKSGGYVSSTLGGTGGAAQTLNRLYATPLILTSAATTSALCIEVATAVASSFERLGIYAAGSDGFPGALLIDAGQQSGAVTGVFEKACSQALAAMTTYWIARVGQGVAPNLTSASITDPYQLPATGSNQLIVSSPMRAVYMDSVSGALPSTFGTPNLVAINVAQCLVKFA